MEEREERSRQMEESARKMEAEAAAKLRAVTEWEETMARNVLARSHLNRFK